MLQWLATAGREQFDPESQTDEVRQRAKGLLEETIVLSKHLRVLLGDEPKVAYPSDELPRVLKSIGERHDCLWVVNWALQRSLSAHGIDSVSL
jgi:hypothetical protein